MHQNPLFLQWHKYFLLYLLRQFFIFLLKKSLILSTFALRLKKSPYQYEKLPLQIDFFATIEKNGSARQRTASPVLIELTTSIAWQRDLHGSVENCGAILVCLPFGRTICSWFSPLAWKNRGWFGCYSKNCSLACLPPTNHERSNSQRSVLVRSRTLFY